MNVNRVKQIFLDLARKVEQAGATELQSGPISDSFLTRGGLVLQGELVQEFLVAVDEIAKLTEGEQQRVASTVDDILSSSLHDILIASSAGSANLAREADLFVSRLRETAKDWVIYAAVFGLEPDCAGLSFGRLTFEVGSYTPVSSLDHRLIRDSPIDLLLARVEIRAVERQTAQSKGEALVERHLAVLNALLTDGRPSYVFLSCNLPHNGRDIRLTRLQTEGEENLWSAQTSLVRHLLAKDDLSKRLSFAPGRVMDESFKSPNEFRERLITAYTFVGTAEREQRPEYAFIFYAIAIETALAIGKGSALTEQLAFRTAHLLYRKADRRKDMYARVKALYELRSKIVHEGEADITKGQLSQIRQIAIAVLGMLCSYETFRKMSRAKELQEWFTQRLLNGEAPIE